MDDDPEGEKNSEGEVWIPPRIRVYKRFRQGGFSGILERLVKDETHLEYPPPSVETFLKRNYKLITLAGAFAAVVVYFSQLTGAPSRPIIFGMIGGAIMFGVAIVAVLKNTAIAFHQAVGGGGAIHAALYMLIGGSLMFISIAMMGYFGRYPVVVSTAIDTILWGPFVILLFVAGSDTVERKEAIIPSPPLQLGRITKAIYYTSPPIAALLMGLIVALLQLLSPIHLLEKIPTYFIDSIILQMLVVLSVFILLTVVVGLFAIIAHLAMRVTIKLRDSTSL